jgi:TonB family protein
MQLNQNYSGQINFGLLPEPEGRTRSFITSTVVNLVILAIAIYIGMTAKRVIDQHVYEQTELIFPRTPPPQPKVKIPPPKELPQPKPKPVELKMQAPKIRMPERQPKPVMKPIQMEAKLTAPAIRAVRPAIVLAPQPRAALTAAAPAQVRQVRVSTAPVHLGETFGVRPNPEATRPATVAALGNPYGGMVGPAEAPRGKVGSTGIGNGTRFGSNEGIVGRVASTGLPGASGRYSSGGMTGHVGSTGIPRATTVAEAAKPSMTTTPAFTRLEVLSKPPVRYTSEARQLKVQGDVVLRVTFLASGHVVVQGIVHGLGHGLDEEARREAEQIRFRPATRNGQAVDMTTNITITFQLA